VKNVPSIVVMQQFGYLTEDIQVTAE